MFNRLKDDLATSTSRFRTLCPTRWIVRAATLQSILDNYNVFQALWEEIQDNITDSEIKARVEATMKKFNFLFGLLLDECILKHTDKLSKTLQDPIFTASEGQQCAELTCITLSNTRSSELFDLFWEKVLSYQKRYDVEDASLPRKRAPSRFEIGCSEGYHHWSVKEYYCQQYFEYLDLIIGTIRVRVNLNQSITHVSEFQKQNISMN